jgi:hypothetical protein
MADLKEQQVCIKFCFKLGEKWYRNLQMLKVCFGEQTVGRVQVFGWFFKFKSGGTSAEDADARCSGHPSMSKT